MSEAGGGTKRIVVAGGHGQIALILERMLAERGDAVAGIVRNPDHVPDLEAVGAEAVVVDLEQASIDEVVAYLQGADAVVFAAGAGPGSGIARKETVDRNAAILLADAAERAGIERYLMISSRGADTRAKDEGMDPVFAAYLRAKATADADVRARSGLNTTIVRPGRLTNEPGTGLVTIADSTGPGSIPREDVAAVLVALLDMPETGGQTFELISGPIPITDALQARLRH
jgi:uncharacterized protein YbjT (DUF2867 family)